MKGVWVIVDDAEMERYRAKWGVDRTEYKLRRMLMKNGFDLRYHVSIEENYQGKNRTLYEQDKQIIEAGEASKHYKDNGGMGRR